MRYKLNLPKPTLASINKRRSILLDTSVWNTLADGKTPESVGIRSILQDLVKKEIIFCPLACPTILELRKQAGTSFQRTSRLMEELSLNITFRGIDQIFDHEINHFLNYLITDKFEPLTNDEQYGSLLSYLSSGFGLDHDKNSEENTELNDHLSSVVKNITLTSLMNMIGEKSSPGPDLAPKYQVTNVRRREAANGNKNKMKRIEQEFIAQEILVPKINKIRSLLPIEQQLYIVDKFDKLPKSKKYGTCLEYILGYFPALSAYIRVLTVSGFDTNRKDTVNDYFDREILIYGLAYSSQFAAIDGWISSLVKLAKDDGDISFLGYSSNLSELEARLQEIKI